MSAKAPDPHPPPRSFCLCLVPFPTPNSYYLRPVSVHMLHMPISALALFCVWMPVVVFAFLREHRPVCVDRALQA